ncbi:FMRFamide receptor-like [Linepithema humile]|uniref:FMRFamide receptor-like n=1 Tax=Linepithema humile TaxID=83485 RepID=UPI0006237448|nr:PREDICTED: FMRFamide receptor-like [Linepithema humile]
MGDKNNPTFNVIEHFNKYYIPIFLCLCLLSNSLSVYVLFFTKLRYNSSSVYLRALAMSDMAVLMTVLMMWFEWKNVINYEDWLHVLLFGLRFLFCFLSVWIVVTFTVIRYIAIKWPLLRRSLCTVNRAKIMMIGLVGLAVLYSIPWFIIESATKKNFDANVEKTNLTYWWRILIITNAIIMLILPVTMIVMFNTLIICIIRKQNCIRKNFILSSVACNGNIRSSKDEISHIKATKMLVIISSIFICLNVPVHICSFILLDNMSGKYFSMILFDMISSILYVTNYGINFILYYATGETFRKEVIRIFTKCSDTKKDEYMEMEDYAKQYN